MDWIAGMEYWNGITLEALEWPAVITYGTVLGIFTDGWILGGSETLALI